MFIFIIFFKSHLPAGSDKGNTMKHKISGPIFIFLLFLLVSSSQAGTVFYQYDGRNNISKAEYSGGGTVEYSFDQMGNRLNRVADVPSQDFELHLKTGTGALPYPAAILDSPKKQMHPGMQNFSSRPGIISSGRITTLPRTGQT